MGIGDNVIEMKVLSAPALYTTAFVTFPDFELDHRGNHSIVIENRRRSNNQQRLIYDLKLELKHLSPIGGFVPGIHQPE